MKRPSLFKTPKHRRFDVAPRYYDPVKEELDARIARIKDEVKREEAGEESEEAFLEHYSASGGLRGAFKQNSHRSKNRSANSMQLVILTLIVLAIAAFWYFGNAGLYVILIVSSLLLYLKLRRII